MIVLPFFTLLLIVSVCRNSFVEVWYNKSPVDGGSPHSLVGDLIMILHEASLMFTNAFGYPTTGGLLGDFSYFIFLNESASSLSLVLVGN